jgi:uncharacterized protein YcbK (DUF882 family)
MGDISTNFNRSEFACKCGCGFDTVDKVTLDLIEKIRFHFAKPITITSGCRCDEYNKKIGGSKNSQHVKARAADIVVKDTHPHEVYDYINGLYPDQFGFGKYSDFTHIDSRTNSARW